LIHSRGRLALALLATTLAGSALAESPYDFGVTYTGEWWRNQDGGLDTGTRYLDNLDVTLSIDAERAFGLSGVEFFLYGLYNNGQTFGGELTGDMHGVSNIETGVQAARLYEAWADWRFGVDRRQSLRFGLYDLNSEFDSIESGSLFINSAHGIGSELADSGQNGPSIFPVTSLALRWRADFERWSVLAAALDGVPGDPAHPKRTAIRFDKGDGALLIAEVQRRGERIRKAAIGVWHYTAEFPDVEAVDVNGDPVMRSGNSGVYGLIDVRLLGDVATPDRQLTGFLRIGVADDDVSPIERYIGAGFTWRGVGLAYAHVHAIAPVRGNEDNLELTWRIPVTGWLTLQPDIQYIINPGLEPGSDHALAFGRRFELAY
jgi:porin